MTATSPRAADTTQLTTPNPSPRRLIMLAMVVLGLCCAGAAVALYQHLPDGATHAVDARRPWHEFIAADGGTAMSPPLPIMVLFAAAIAACASHRWIGIVGAVAVAIGGIAFTVGMAVEPVTRQVLSTHPDAVKTPLAVLALVAAPVTAVTAILHVRLRLKALRPRSGR